MGFQKGQGGRPAGAKNKRTKEYMAVLEKQNFCPATALVKILQEAIQQYEIYKERLESGRISPMEDNGHKYLKIASDNAKELASYAYPKLKSIEQTNEMKPHARPLAHLTDEELDAIE